MEKPWFDLARAGEWLLDLERRVKPDVVHLNSYIPAALAFHAPKLVVGHSCVLSWWRAVRGEPAPSEWNWYRYQVTRALHAADLVIAPSHAMLAALQRHYGPLPAAEVVPNGRDPKFFRPLPKENLVLVAGRLWDEAKNLESLVEVAPELPWPIYVAGEVQHPDRPQCATPSRLRAGATLTRRPGPLVRSRIHLCAPGPLRAFWPLRSGGRPERVRLGVRRHSQPTRHLGGCGTG
jgi:glycogen(starch) synthase